MYESSDDGKLDVSLTLEYLANNTLHEYLRGFTFREFLNAKSSKGENTPTRKTDYADVTIRFRFETVRGGCSMPRTASPCSMRTTSSPVTLSQKT